jgi:hypothetical protein
MSLSERGVFRFQVLNATDRRGIQKRSKYGLHPLARCGQNGTGGRTFARRQNKAFNRRGKLPTEMRKRRIAELRDDLGLTAQEIYDQYGEELSAIYGKKVSFATVQKDYSWRPKST